MEQQTVRIRVYGKVQDVNFRSEAKKKADELSLRGYARNEPDGSVLIIVQGDGESVAKMEELARQGLGSGKVTGMETEAVQDPEQFEHFDILWHS